ncbi:Hypothetical predicted protein [Octopus vulgaris]|uniref:Uncharacterized protein n=1 Tax=Octopus vulgaris TaxID=6645 RepID=A0AA36B3E9_OCTVU|nr:Hypothetical predicted protein [Octopus vulgaris]
MTNFEMNGKENRNQKKIFIDGISRNISENMLDFAACSVYNGLPDDIKATQNINTFNRKPRRFNYNEIENAVKGQNLLIPP